MREYFTILVKENDTSNLGLLTEKLNSGFFLNDRIPVGRSTIIVLQKITEVESLRNTGRLIASDTDACVPTSISLY